MHQPATTHVGPLGSTIHVLRADAGTIAELAAIDWGRCFRGSASTRCAGSSP